MYGLVTIFWIQITQNPSIIIANTSGKLPSVHDYKHLTCIKLCNPPHSPVRWVAISSFYKWRKWSLERLHKWLNDTQLLRGRSSSELNLVPESTLLGTLLYYLLEALLWREIWGSCSITSLTLQMRNQSPREVRWLAQGYNYFVTAGTMTVYAFVCKTEAIGDRLH